MTADTGHALTAARSAVDKVGSDDEARGVITIIRQKAQALRAQAWRPYVWQHPHRHPAGWVSERWPGRDVCDSRCADLPTVTPAVHGLWVQRGGRGTGKTEGAAHYVDAHVNGPPCDLRVPGGHRLTIIAPTQADAVSSCVEGVSGLKAINPLIRVSTGREGTIARWPNGSVARLLGAHSREDVQRVRAWTNICLAAGTPIATATGPVPVEDVQVGDLVWTRTGLRPVTRAACTGIHPVVHVTGPGADAWMTPDHPVARPDGTFTRADAGGRILVWAEDESSTAAGATANEQTATTEGSSGSSTGSCTPPRSDPSRTVGTSTTSTTTRPTTPRATSSPSHRLTTPMSMTAYADRSGTPPEDAHQQQAASPAPASVSSAEPSSPTAAPPPPASAPPAAETRVLRHEHTRSACAACVAAGSPAHAGTPPAPAPHRAEVSPPTRRAPVYDLTVDGHHEFIAGGIIVGNCMAWVEEAAAMTHLGGLSEADSPAGVLDQLPFTLRLGDTAHIVVTTTPMNRPEVQALLTRPDRIETWGRTQDAYRLPTVVREALETRFGGTTAGAQELDGDLIADTPGALWVSHRPDLVDGQPNPDQRPGISNDRVNIDPTLSRYGWTSHDPDAPTPPAGTLLMERVIIGVDPPGGRTECGITVHGTINQHGYLLADLSLAGPPDTWARVALLAWRDYGAEGIAAEHTYGGDMVTDVLSTRARLMIDAGELSSMPAIFRVPTKVGKRLRAEPVQALGQQHRLHHLGYHPGVETEQTTWVPGDRESPNRLDAYVHGFTYLLVRNAPGQIANPARSGTRFTTTTGR